MIVCYDAIQEVQFKKAHPVYEMEDEGVINDWAMDIRKDFPELMSVPQFERRGAIFKADE